MNFTPKNMLVTGAAGFIGCNFVRHMLGEHKDIKIISYDKLTYAGSLDNLKCVIDDPRHFFIKGDICDKEQVAKTLRKFDIDTIIHFAAESHVDNSIACPEIFLQTNVMGTFHLIEEARKFWQDEKSWGSDECRFHHISTDEVYGTLKAKDPAFTEKTPYAPSSPYSASKASSDHVVRSYSETYQLPVTLSNCSNNYGPYQHNEKLIPVIIANCLEQKPIPIYGDGSNIRDWLFVEDHCAAIDLILQKGRVGESYNVGGDNEISNLDLAKMICQLMDELKPSSNSYQEQITFVEDRKGHDWRYAIDQKKIKADLDFKLSNGFDEALTKTLQFYLELTRENAVV